MVNPQLIEWIKKELSLGASSRKIRSVLLSHGWNKQDIDEAFSVLGVGGPKKFPFLVILLGVLVVILGVIVYFVLFHGSSSSNSGSSSYSSNAPSQLSGVVSNSIACSDVGCLVNASKNCSRANFTSKDSIDLFGLNTTETSYLEINPNGSNCSLYQKVLNLTITYDSDLVQQLLDSGVNQSQIDEQQKKSNNAVSASIGKNETCVFSSLTNMTKYITKEFVVPNSPSFNFSFTVSANVSCNLSSCNESGSGQPQPGGGLADSCSGSLYNTSDYPYTS